MRYYFLDEANQPQGPVEIEALRKLRDANVLNDASLVAAEGAADWSPLHQVLGAAPIDPVAATVKASEAGKGAGALAAGAGEASSHASLFYWIAGLSMVNAFSGAVGSTTYFFFGLGVSMVIGAIGHEMGPVGIGIALVVNAVIAALFAMFGYFGNRYHLWPYFVGGILYLLDGLLFLLMGEWLSVIFHAGILFFLIKGALASRGIGEA